MEYVYIAVLPARLHSAWAAR